MITRLIRWLKQHVNIWWLAFPLLITGLTLHLEVAWLHYHLRGDPWYLVIFVVLVGLGAMAAYRIKRLFRSS